MKRKDVSLILLAMLAILTTYAFAVPEGPDSISRGPSENSGSGPAGVAQVAFGGNLTPIVISASPQTNRWQGFFGNITGTLALDDANSNSMYQWQLATPQGEVFAVNSSTAPSWSEVMCFNFSADSNQNVTLSELETSLGMATNDPDGVNETFNLTSARTFTVGTKTLTNSSGCKQVSLNVNDAYQQLRFNETLLTDNTSRENVIYVSFLESDNANFRTGGETSDFQMIVGENGETAANNNYWFYVELD